MKFFEHITFAVLTVLKTNQQQSATVVCLKKSAGDMKKNNVNSFCCYCRINCRICRIQDIAGSTVIIAGLNIFVLYLVMLAEVDFLNLSIEYIKLITDNKQTNTIITEKSK